MAKKRSLRAVDASSTPAALPNEDLAEFNLYIEDELEALLDADSDETFGAVDYRNVEKKAKLSTWSAQDFSNIYLRYRPHLERHARRFLNNQTQVDEVVQDAFLYLMVTLPDLDSELGVLRFLKWKVRLICLDVIRASSRAHLNSIDDHPEIMADDPEISAGLEQADDAAIVKLALSKLNPRHREVLIASLYEEKSHEEIAAQVGLSENATRQLIFRARAAFKKALLGDDINTDGMSVSAILSVAARKAAEDAKKVGAQAMVFVLFLALAIGAFTTFGSRAGSTQNLADGNSTTPEVLAPAPAESVTPDVAPTIATQTTKTKVTPEANLAPASNPSATPTLIPDEAATKLVAAANSADPSRFVMANTDSTATLVLEQKGGIQLFFEVNKTSETNSISKLNILVPYRSETLRLLPTEAQSTITFDEDGNKVVTYQAKMAYLYDRKGRVTNESVLNKQFLTIRLVISATDSSVKIATARLVSSQKDQ